MKLMFASDLHGSRPACEAMLDLYKKEQAQRLILLGDLLYHGPRNDLPEGYEPKAVIAMLNAVRDELLCVQGNCDAVVDQMVLSFPIMAEYMLLPLFLKDGRILTAFVTHGHVHNLENPPPHKAGDLIIHGHTHVLTITQGEGLLYINPGSVALPKEGNLPSYMVYEDGTFTIKALTGAVLCTHTL